MSKLLAPDGSKNLIGKKLKELRVNRSLSQEHLMQELQLQGFDSDRGVIKRMEAGSRFISDVELKLISSYFDVSYEYLLDDEQEPPEKPK